MNNDNIDLLEVARAVGLRELLHGVSAEAARPVLKRFVEAVNFVDVPKERPPAQAEPSPDTEQHDPIYGDKLSLDGAAGVSRRRGDRATDLRFIQRVLEGDAPKPDRERALAMVRDMRRAQPPADGRARRDAVDTLRKFAEGRITHHNNGLCPDVVEGYGQRDLDCAVCQALAAIEAEGNVRG